MSLDPALRSWAPKVKARHQSGCLPGLVDAQRINDERNGFPPPVNAAVLGSSLLSLLTTQVIDHYHIHSCITMMPTVTEKGATVVSLKCENIDDMYADGDEEAYTKLWNVTVKTADGKEKIYPNSCFIYYENPMSHHYCSLTEVDGGNSYVSRDAHGRPVNLQFTQLEDDSWLGELASPGQQQAAESELFTWPGTN